MDQWKDAAKLQEIANKFAIYADEHRIEEQAALFTEDGIWTVYGADGSVMARNEGREKIYEASRNTMAGFDRSFHMNGQFLVTQLGEDTAKSTSYCSVFLQKEETIARSNVVYCDEYVKAAGQWYLLKRDAHFVMAYSENA